MEVVPILRTQNRTQISRPSILALVFEDVTCQKFMIAHIFNLSKYLRLFITRWFVRINIRMEKARPWPTNIYGNQWRAVTLCYDWADKETVCDIIHEIDPLKIIIRYSRTVAAIGFRNVTDMVAARLMVSWSDIQWDADKLHAIVDPCDPEAMASDIEQWWWPVRFSVFGISVVHLADEHTYRHLRTVLKDRRHLLTGRIPMIGF